MPLNVAFLWHMHQPYYVDPVRGVALMSWVRLHATKGYLDMIWTARQFPELRCTFNLTPVLIKQIRQLADGKVGDLWHDLATVPAASLTEPQQCALLEHFFKAHVGHMIKPHPRYWSLLQQRGLQIHRNDLPGLTRRFQERDYRDLQVWFHLAWFGYAAEKLYGEIAELKRQGRDFTEQDKKTVLDRQQDVLRICLAQYRDAAAGGQVELSTTPFYHPILPLVCNTEFARRCMPGRQLPRPFSHPEDVRAQLTLARDFHAETFGQRPHGVWPSEGSVCPELVDILQDLGYEWMASDEEVLWRSLPAQGDHGIRLYQGFRIQHGSATICASFRDRTASDFIGFTAARNTAEQAAGFLIDHFRNVARTTTGADGLCPVILDGENAWEHFPDGGERFLRELYRRLTGTPELRTTTFHDYYREHPPSTVVTTLHTGSWIRADFDIWIGDPEENRAWDLLGQTRDFLQARADRGEIEPAALARAMDEIYAAEGSDWFWWYGGDFVTENDLIFDELFRAHLHNVYRIAGVAVPEALKIPICRSEAPAEARPPVDLIHPRIDGQVTSYYEWSGAGSYDPSQALVTMYRTERFLDAVYFGFDLQRLYVRADFHPAARLPARAGLRLVFQSPTGRAIVIPELRPGSTAAALWDTSGGEGPIKVADVEACFGSVLELSIPFDHLPGHPRERIGFFVQVLDGDLELERHPETGAFDFTVPDSRYELERWQV